MSFQTPVFVLKNKNEPVDKYEIEFEKSGFQPEFLSPLKHVQTNIDKLGFALIDVMDRKYDGIIVTSQRSIEAIQESINCLRQEIKDLLLSKVEIYAVGPASYDALLKIGFKCIFGRCTGNGKKLAQELNSRVENSVLKFSSYSSTKSVESQSKYEEVNDTKKVSEDTINHHSSRRKFLLLVGKPHSDNILVELKRLNSEIILEKLIVYETNFREDFKQILKNKFLPYKDKRKRKPWLIFFSPFGIDAVFEIDNKILESFFIATIGPTTANYLRKLQITPQVVASNPTPQSLIQSIISFQRKYVQLF